MKLNFEEKIPFSPSVKKAGCQEGKPISEGRKPGSQEGKRFNALCHPELYKANRQFCHPELDSGSKNCRLSLYPSGDLESVHSGKWKLPWDKMLKQVQHDKFGFTLAEVLITLGIIGVVAAITIPNMITNYQDRQVVTKLKKNLAVFNQAIKLTIAEYGDLEYWELEDITYKSGDDDITKKFPLTTPFVNHLKVARDCGHEAKGCFTSLPYYRKFVMPDGTLVATYFYAKEQKTATGKGEIWVDLNGNKGPNTVGKDMFLLYVNKDHVEPYPRDNLSITGYGSAKYVLQNGNRNYLRNK